jgi:hypothetical protein
MYAFTTHTFTNAGAVGRNGPTLSQCVSSYSGASWASNTAYFNMTTQGIQIWTVPASGNYQITCVGAGGGLGQASNPGGFGARMRGTFALTQGQKLRIIAGQLGTNNTGLNGGGGGASFVMKESGSTTSDILVIAGGGGGGPYTNNGTNRNATTGDPSQPGWYGDSNTTLNNGQSSGNGGICYNRSGAGGGGLTGNGGSSTVISESQGGFSFTNGAIGGTGLSNQSTSLDGGFGGGGSGEWSTWTGAGGGGGYSGGSGGYYYGGGGGGSSYNNGTSQTNTIESAAAMGFVTITALSSSPTVTTTAASNLFFFSATSGGNVTSDGGATITARGIVWHTSPSPTIALTTKTTESGTTGAFTSSLTGLRQNTVYYIRAYATNSVGTSYGSEITIQTLEFFTGLTLSSFNHNTIAYGTGNNASTITTVPMDQGQSVYYTQEYGLANGQTTGGIPNSGTIPLSNGFFQIQTPFSSLTTIRLSTLNSRYTIGVVSSMRFSKLNLLGATGNGSATLQAIVQYGSGPSTVVSGLVFQDWFGGSNFAISSLSRVNRNTSVFDGRLDFRIYSNQLSINSTQSVSSLTFVYTSASGPTANLYGVSGSAIPELAQLQTSAITSIVYTGATSGGTVLYDGGADITARGIVWNIAPNPTIALATRTTESGTTGTFVSNMTSLTPNTTYYVRAYATNFVGTAYGPQLLFTTPPPDPPAVASTTSVSSISYYTATSGGSVSAENGATITARGIVWDTNTNPTVSLSTKTVQGGTTGSFVSNLTGLVPNTTYYVRAYATNSAGTGYGPEITFSTLPPTIPIVASTTAASVISFYTATSGGNVTSDEGATITARGVVWDTNTDPTVALATKTVQTGTTGSFVSNLTGLTPNTTYYVRAYATNSVGTSYASQISFSTLPPTVPTVTTTAVSPIFHYSATSGGNVSSDNGATITARGIVWDVAPNPTVALSTKTVEAGTIGTYTSQSTGLNPLTLYYVRAYATNAIGTAYGSQVTFTTTSIPLIERDSNTYLYYRFSNDSNESSIVLDHGPNFNHGTLYSGQIVVEQNRKFYRVEGGCGSAIQMTRFVSGITQAAYAVWIRLRSPSTNPAGIVVSRGGGGGICGLVLDGMNVRHYWNGEYSEIPSAINLTVGEWTHIAVAIFPTESRWYVNGELVETKALVYEQAEFGNAFVGIDPRDCGYTLDADLDDVLVNLGEYRQANVTQAYLNRDAQSTYYDGYLTNFRWIKGQAAYTSTYRVPTSALPSTALTDLLLWTPNEQTSSVVRDYSLMNKTVYHYATPWSPLSPFLDPVPTVVSNTSYIIADSTSLFFGGNVTNIGGSAILARGIVWGTSPSPTVSATTKTTEPGSVGTFTSRLTDLVSGVFYYMRAYATNTFGTAYGAEEIVRIGTGPIVSTMTTSTLSSSIGIAGGNLVELGSDFATRRGIVWSEISSPTIALSTRTIETGLFSTGAFSTLLTNLSVATTYYTRAYAQVLNATTSSIVTYGQDVTLTTAVGLPLVSTGFTSTMFSGTSAVTGHIVNSGGLPITLRGVVWRSTFSGPTLETSEKVTESGSFGAGPFTLGTNNMWDGVFYYIRSFGSNALGLVYGNEVVSSSYYYFFDTMTFTTAGATGRSGPTLSQCRSAYAAIPWTQSSQGFFNMTTQGVQLWTVPGTGLYQITAIGAGGGTGPSATGRGAFLSGVFSLTRGQVLKIVVGQQGLSTTSSPCSQSHGGGGGGSFVTTLANVPLIIAGGGGGGGNTVYDPTRLNGTLTNNGSQGDQPFSTGIGGGAGGTGGLGGSVGVGCTTSTSYGSSAGGGLTGNGASVGTTVNGYTSTGGTSFVSGALGGNGGTWTAVGGFGGGGASGDSSGGGGGGYSGGGGAGWNGCICLDAQGGGGGGSFNIGSSQINTFAYNSGQGSVIITRIDTPVMATETPSSLTVSSISVRGSLLDIPYNKTIVSRGFVWDTNPNPTISLSTFSV